MTEKTWREYEEQVRSLPPTTNIELPKQVDVPPHFFESRLASDKGAKTSYRENRPQNSLHLREYDDQYTVHVDRFNPHHHPIRHAVYDAAKECVTAAAAVAGFSIAAVAAAKGVAAAKS